jgi:hypothetical protein
VSKQGPFQNLDKKTFRQGIIELLESEYKLLGSHKVLELIADDIVALEHKYHPKSKETSLGHLSWVTTSDENDKPRLGQTREEYKQEVIQLPYITEEDIKLKRQNVSKVKHDSIRLERLTKAAKEQGGLLTVEELAAILNRSPATISKRIKEYHKENDEVLSLKGYELDIGPGVSHKTKIIRFYERGMAPPDIARNTRHSLKAVERYIKDYERIKFLVHKNVKIIEIRHMTGRGKKVINAYIDIIKEYHPEFIGGEKDQ